MPILRAAHRASLRRLIAQEKKAKFNGLLADPQFGASGLVADATVIMDTHVHEHPKTIDKMGILQEAVAILAVHRSDLPEDVSMLKKRVALLCQQLRRAIAPSQQAARRTTGQQAIKRLIDDYFKTHKESSPVFDIQLLVERIQRDTKLLGKDGEVLDASLGRLLNELSKVRASDQKHFRDASWLQWKAVLGEIRQDPLGAVIEISDQGPFLVTMAASIPNTVTNTPSTPS